MTRLTGPIMDKEIWSEYLKDRSITDCAIRTKDIIYLLARQNPPEDAGTVPDEDLDTQLVIYYGDEDEPDELFSGALLSYFRRPKLAVQFEPCVQAVVKNSNGQIYFHGSGAADIEHIRPGYRLATFNVCTVGEHVYAVGSMRKVFRRDDIGQWTEMRQGIPTPKTREEADWWGFRDIDGFSEDDMYAVGGRGDVWRFDGRRWRACALPTNIFLYNVCCAPDGFVYIGGQGGTLYKGRYDTWQRLHQGYSHPFTHISQVVVPYGCFQ